MLIDSLPAFSYSFATTPIFIFILILIMVLEITLLEGNHLQLLSNLDEPFAITPNEMDQIEREIQSHPNISNLSLYNCAINTDNIQIITNIIQSIPNLSSLDLDQCKCDSNSPELLEEICSAIESSCPIFKSLEFHYIDIGSEGAMYLATYLQSNRSLARLELHDSSITTSGMDAITQSLLSNHSTLTDLNLADCKIGISAARSIGSIIQSNVLKSLCLFRNSLGSDGAKEIVNALRSNTSFKHLLLVSNGIKGGVLDELARFLTTNTSIVHLDLGI